MNWTRYKILFADYRSPKEHADSELDKFREDTLNPKRNTRARAWWDIFVEQVLNATIVGGCAGFSALAADVEGSWKVGLYAFGLAFFFELRKYRKI